MHHEYIDRFAQGDSPMHRLDPRAKLISVVFFIGVVISVPRYEALALFPYLVYPAFLFAASGIPMAYVAKHILMVSPFIIFLVIFAPLFDRIPVFQWHGIVVTTGMLAMMNIFLKFVMTVGVSLFLISTTRFDRLLKGLLRMKAPRILVMQLSFLYRYLFLLIDEAQRMKMAREARSYGKAALRLRIRTVGYMIGVLFLKTLERAEKVYAAMIARGFNGNIPLLTPLRFRFTDGIFTAASLLFVGIIRFAQSMYYWEHQ